MPETKTRILIVEDDPNDQALLRRTFRDRADIAIWMVFSGEEAIECLTKHPPYNLVLLDLNLPAMRLDGLAVIRQLQHLGIKTPVVVLTGLDGGPLVTALKEAHVLTTISKPLTDAKLNQLLEMIWV